MGKKKLKRILFVYDHEYPHLWKDGLWAAIQLLLKDFEVVTYNLQTDKLPPENEFHMVLGWGGFESPVERKIRDMKIPKGLCIGGNAFPPVHADDYDVLFYETDWYKPLLAGHRNAIKAFGVNTNIYFPTNSTKVFDIITVGAFANWKRHYMLQKYSGNRLAIGQIQKGNKDESFNIIDHLLFEGVMVSDMVEPEQLAKLYNASHLCYIPADLNGGGERAILEARACGIMVDCEPDNEKLTGLLKCDVPTEENYYKALKYGIETVI